MPSLSGIKLSNFSASPRLRVRYKPFSGKRNRGIKARADKKSCFQPSCPLTGNGLEASCPERAGSVLSGTSWKRPVRNELEASCPERAGSVLSRTSWKLVLLFASAFFTLARGMVLRVKCIYSMDQCLFSGYGSDVEFPPGDRLK